MGQGRPISPDGRGRCGTGASMPVGGRTTVTSAATFLDPGCVLISVRFVSASIHLSFMLNRFDSRRHPSPGADGAALLR